MSTTDPDDPGPMLTIERIVYGEGDAPRAEAVTPSEARSAFVDGARANALAGPDDPGARDRIGFVFAPAGTALDPVPEDQLPEYLSGIFTAAGFSGLHDVVASLRLAEGHRLGLSSREYGEDDVRNATDPRSHTQRRRERLEYLLEKLADSRDPVAVAVVAEVRRLLARYDAVLVPVAPWAASAFSTVMSDAATTARQQMARYGLHQVEMDQNDMRRQTELVVVARWYEPGGGADEAAAFAELGRLLRELHGFRTTLVERDAARADAARAQQEPGILQRLFPALRPPAAPDDLQDQLRAEIALLEDAADAMQARYLLERQQVALLHPVVARIAEKVTPEIIDRRNRQRGQTLADLAGGALARVITSVPAVERALAADPAIMWRFDSAIIAAARAIGYDERGFDGRCVREQLAIAKETKTPTETLQEALGAVMIPLGFMTEGVGLVAMRLLQVLLAGLIITGYENELAFAFSSLDPLHALVAEEPESGAIALEALLTLL